MRELFCKPKARCFKGLGILFGVYTLGCALMLMIIPPVINVHSDTKDDQVATNLHKMVVATCVLLATFFVLAVVNLFAFKMLDKKEKRHMAILQGDLIPHG